MLLTLLCTVSNIGVLVTIIDLSKAAVTLDHKIPKKVKISFPHEVIWNKHSSGALE